MNFTPSNFVGNLHYLVAGMAGIFLVIGIIILMTVILNRLTKKK